MATIYDVIGPVQGGQVNDYCSVARKEESRKERPRQRASPQVIASYPVWETHSVFFFFS